MLNRRGTRAERGVPRPRQETLILLDQEASRLVGGPVPLPRARHSRPGFFRRRGDLVIVVAAIVTIAVGAGTVAALRSHSTHVGQVLPVLGVVPTFPRSGAHPSASPTATHSATPHASAPASAAAGASTTPAMAQPAPSQTTTTEAAPPTVVVTYRIVGQWYGGFKAEIEVVNNTSKPISGWEMAVALKYDTFISWWNATGFVSNGILLLSQPAWQGPIAADGGTLQVSFVVSGFQTTPNDCGFQDYICTIG